MLGAVQATLEAAFMYLAVSMAVSVVLVVQFELFSSVFSLVTCQSYLNIVFLLDSCEYSRLNYIVNIGA